MQCNKHHEFQLTDGVNWGLGSDDDMARFKFNMYLPGATWSTSLKRYLSAGSITIFPDPPEFETYEAAALASSGVGLTVNLHANDVCNEYLQAC